MLGAPRRRSLRLRRDPAATARRAAHAGRARGTRPCTARALRQADRPAAPIPIYVDEDCHTLPDVARCSERAHGINIKLSKSGGIREAIRMAHAARSLGLGVMLGCMTESGLGISAGAQIASLCDFVDLDGNLLLLEDPWPGVEFRDGVQLPPDKPGLGVAAAVSVGVERSDDRN